MGLRTGSARPQRVSGSARTDSRRAESARNPIASHVNFGDDSALNVFTRTQWTATLTGRRVLAIRTAENDAGTKLHWVSILFTQMDIGIKVKMRVLKINHYTIINRSVSYMRYTYR